MSKLQFLHVFGEVTFFTVNTIMQKFRFMSCICNIDIFHDAIKHTDNCNVRTVTYMLITYLYI